MPNPMLIKPDLQTRESVMLAAGRAQFAVTTPEGVRYVKIECKSTDVVGATKRYTSVPLDLATHVFISEKGYGTPRLGTYYPPKSGYDTGRFFIDNAISADDAHLEALYAVIDFVNNGDATMEVTAEDRCGLCGRELTDPVSIKRGIGPECASKPTGSIILHASAFHGEQTELPVEQSAYDAMQAAGAKGDFDEVERLAALQTDAEVAKLGSLEKVAGVPTYELNHKEMALVLSALCYTDRELSGGDVTEYTQLAEKVACMIGAATPA